LKYNHTDHVMLCYR